jgi:hypothetical protein
MWYLFLQILAGTLISRTLNSAETHYFQNTPFGGIAFFIGSQFHGDADFAGSNFKTYAFFSEAQFDNEASFAGVTFGGYADFAKVQFKGNADFTKAKFNETADFKKTLFNKNSNFEAVRFDIDALFNDAQFGGNGYFQGSVFHKKTDLTGAKFDRMYIRWNSIKELNADESAYLSLIKNYDNLGWYNDSNDCYYGYRVAVLKQEPMGIPFFIDTLEVIFYGYGVKPLYPISWSVAIIFGFALYFWFRNSIIKIIRRTIIERKPNKNEPNEIQFNTTFEEELVTFTDCAFFSLSNFTSNFTSFFQPNTQFELRERDKRFATCERLLGSLFIALILATITKTYLMR